MWSTADIGAFGIIYPKLAKIDQYDSYSAPKLFYWIDIVLLCSFGSFGENVKSVYSFMSKDVFMLSLCIESTWHLSLHNELNLCGQVLLETGILTILSLIGLLIECDELISGLCNGW